MIGPVPVWFRLWRKIVNFFSLIALFSVGFSSVEAQIGYVQTQGDGSLQLHRMNADGTGDAQIALPFTTFELPVFSRDATQLAVSALDPALPNQRSHNVFSLSTTNGAINELTFFGDLVSDGVIIYNFPNYKAFSPDNTRLAVFTYIFTGDLNNVGTQTTTPSLEVYSTSSAFAPLQVHVDKGLNGKHHGGEGVDWSPDGTLLVAPLEGTTNFISGGGTGEVTALSVIEPIVGAVLSGHSQQITFPRADSQISPTAYLWGEHDYAPKFSPNGRGVAFVRSFQNFFLLDSVTPDPDIQSIHIVDLTTGVDTQLIQFNPGFYISTLDWSPDGSQLVFDLGQQEPGPLGPQQHAIPATNEIYVINNDGSGLQRLRTAGSSSPVWSRSAIPALVAPPNLGNISTRLSVGTGDSVMIGGFIITGPGDKNVIVRAIGPSLGTGGLAGALSDTVLELHDQTGAIIATNDDWKSTQKDEIIATTVPPTNDKESAIVRRLNPGSYTAVVVGKNNATGIALVEAYGLDGTARLANISTRGLVQTGDNVMIGGFIVLDNGNEANVIVRAIGPSLAGVSNALADPTLEIHDQNGATVASNDNWKSTQQTEIIATTVPPPNDKESAIVEMLPAGAYTAIVRGKNNTTGVALVEAYNLQ
ncbi:MAG: hypothetical protein M3Q46_01390 [Verrucomicrobiota bacterium]|nr:hypothetical protein [Verrucomicrobiota bacterium]